MMVERTEDLILQAWQITRRLVGRVLTGLHCDFGALRLIQKQLIELKEINK
jgi:hypothetical protein